jgi:NAD(P)-dependent dehydrogenase (short-subunit alcohol dehydrogenase family)
MRLDGKIAIITGAGSGLGRASALRFAGEGARLVLVDVNGDRAEESAKLVAEAGGEARPCTADVSREVEVAEAVDLAVAEFGRLDIMFANAGIMSPGLGAVPFDELTEEEWRSTLDVNLTGAFFSCKHAVRAMKRNPGGAILLTSSMAALRAYPGAAAYGASKGGINSLVVNLSLEVGAHGIRVNAICPSGGMSSNFLLPRDAPVTGASYDELRAWRPEKAPYPLKLDRPPTLDDNAAAALFLVSDEAVWMTGLCLPTADGGLINTVATRLSGDWQTKLSGGRGGGQG